MKNFFSRLFLFTRLAAFTLGLYGGPLLAAEAAQIPPIVVQLVVPDDEPPLDESLLLPSHPSQIPQIPNHIPFLIEPDSLLRMPDYLLLEETAHDGFFLRIYPNGPSDGYKIRTFPIDPFTDYELKVIPPNSTPYSMP